MAPQTRVVVVWGGLVLCAIEGPEQWTWASLDDALVQGYAVWTGTAAEAEARVLPEFRVAPPIALVPTTWTFGRRKRRTR